MLTTFIGADLPSAVRTVEELERLNRAFGEILKYPPLRFHFEEELLRYINITELLPECDPRSLGIDWLNNNTSTFAKLTDHADPRDFLRRCFTNDFVSNVLYNKELLMMIPAAARGEFILELLENQSPWGYDWFEVVKEVVPGFNIGEHLVMRLVDAHPDSAFFRDFTKPGKSATVLWGELNATQFLLAVHAVVSKKPELMFEPDSANRPCFRQRVEARLNKERQPEDGAQRISDLLIASAKKLTSLEGVSYSVFNRLPRTEQRVLLRQVADEKMRCSILFVTEMAADKGQTFFMPFLNGAIRTPRPTEDPFGAAEYEYTVSITEYLELRRLFDRIRQSDNEAGTSGRHESLIASIDGIYRATLEREKYVHFGTLVKNTYPKRTPSGRRMCTRLIVEIEAQQMPRYVYQYTQHERRLNPTLREGDTVAFSRDDNPPFYSNPCKSVYLTTFTLIERAPQTAPKPGPRPRR